MIFKPLKEYCDSMGYVFVDFLSILAQSYTEATWRWICGRYLRARS